MKHYIELTLLPNLEIPIHFIWEKVYQQIHLALVGNKRAENESAVGVAFPEYDADEYSLGTRLRLFAEDEQTLEQMQLEKWLNRLGDYVHLSGIKPVPDTVQGYACFRHVKLKGSKEKLARRRAKRTGKTLQQALAHFETYEEERSRLPYINMHSETNGQRFRLFIEKKPKEQAQTGLYSCYGLSSNTTVPLF